MWTSKIDQKDFNRGQFTVVVSYLKGAETFNESYTLQALKDLDFVISNRLRVLNENDALDASYPLGDFTPNEVSVPVDTVDPLQEKLSELAKLKQLVDLKVIEPTDKGYTDALTAAKAEYDK